MLSNHNPNVSLLPDNPSAQIMPVQGGGGTSGLWHSSPVKMELNGIYQLALNHGFLKKFKTRWRQTLGPNIPSRRKPRQDPHIIVGSLNASENPVYLVAPLRGNLDEAIKVFSWSDTLLEKEPESHIVFIGPLTSNNTNVSIESGMSALLSKYPGHVIFVSDKETGLPSVDGLLLEAVPHTSKQISLGFIPSHENVYNRSSRKLGKLIVETLRIPFSKQNSEESLESIYSIKFQEPTTIQGREKDFDQQSIIDNILFKSIPGWVTRVRYEENITRGGASTYSMKNALNASATAKGEVVVREDETEKNEKKETLDELFKVYKRDGTDNNYEKIKELIPGNKLVFIRDKDVKITPFKDTRSELGFTLEHNG